MPHTVLCPHISAYHGHTPKTPHDSHGPRNMEHETPSHAFSCTVEEKPCLPTLYLSLFTRSCVCPALQALPACDAGVVESVSICRAGEFSCPLRCGVLFMADCNHLQWAREEGSSIIQAFQVRQCAQNHTVSCYSNTYSVTVIHAVLLLLCCQLGPTHTSCMMHGSVVCQDSPGL